MKKFDVPILINDAEPYKISRDASALFKVEDMNSFKQASKCGYAERTERNMELDLMENNMCAAGITNVTVDSKKSKYSGS